MDTSDRSGNAQDPMLNPTMLAAARSAVAGIAGYETTLRSINRLEQLAAPVPTNLHEATRRLQAEASSAAQTTRNASRQARLATDALARGAVLAPAGRYDPTPDLLLRLEAELRQARADAATSRDEERTRTADEARRADRAERWVLASFVVAVVSMIGTLVAILG
jgi:hypothetical protein